ncbi:MAG TPA: TolC family protein [Candidatus Saccharimonadales bacterium]|nr:TolC family protein [Candidatus Saccharimonadales bacterium]
MNVPAPLPCLTLALVLFVMQFSDRAAAWGNSVQEVNDRHTGAIPLGSLIEEANSRNPQILAAVHSYKAAAAVPKRVAALPDTQVVIQQFSVGSPRPFAGYTTSDFAYIGIGGSQDFPYPGKRKLRAEVARHDADSFHAQSETVRQGVIERVKDVYLHLASAQQSIKVFQRYDEMLVEMLGIADSRYRMGQGNRQEVVKTQRQRAKIQQEIMMGRRDEGRLEAQLKQLLGRDQESADIQTELLKERAMPYSPSQLLRLVGEQNPAVLSRQATLKQAQSQVALAHQEFRPDFSLQYMYQNTDRKFPDYYLLTFGFTLPNRGRRQAELAETQEKRKGAQQELEAEVQRLRSELQQQVVVARSSEEQLKIYREQLVPQAEATFREAFAAYQANRQDAETLLSLLLEALELEVQYQRELADHESALAEVEALTGVTLP